MSKFNKTKILNTVFFVFNILAIAVMFTMNYFYQKAGFDYTLKCSISGMFASLGIINLIYALFSGAENKKFHVMMAAGLVLAMMGDVYINRDFITGAAVFAMGHVCFVVAYCFLWKMRITDIVISGVLFIGGAAFLMSPLLTFKEPLFKYICVGYDLIISLMLGKAVGNFIKSRNIFTGLVAFASALFFFSDLMLVLDWFIGRWDWTDNACMGTYYPALCFLALSMIVKIIKDKKNV